MEKPSVLASKILIVDDNPANVLLLQSLLEMHEFTEIDSTTDPREVLALQASRRYDLLLLDLKMPYLDGLQVLELLAPTLKQQLLPVIMITAQNDQEHKVKALELGARDFIGKPFDPIEVMARVNNLLEIQTLQRLLVLKNRELEHRVIERTRELVDLQHEFFQKLLQAAEFRDDSTGQHITRIGTFARELGRLSGLSLLQCEDLFYASMMHDVGKIAVPDHILLKPGPLTPEEWTAMKDHTTKGALFLSNSSVKVINLGEEVARHHHERWDGKGYPAGLSGEQIPIEARITSICDIFDALLAERPYKKAWPLEKVVLELKALSGTALDPALTALFLDNLWLFESHLREFGTT